MLRRRSCTKYTIYNIRLEATNLFWDDHDILDKFLNRQDRVERLYTLISCLQSTTIAWSVNNILNYFILESSSCISMFKKVPQKLQDRCINML